jgi:hypothetical protein
MKIKLTPYYISLTKDACFKSFWRKQALSDFLRHYGVSEAFLAGLATDSKRNVLDRIFVELHKSDHGKASLFQMALDLMEQKTFPDLQSWEDSAQKIKAAHDAVSRLSMHHSKQQEELKNDEDGQRAKEEFRKRQAEAVNEQQSLQKLDDRLKKLSQALGDQKAGFDFQDWFFDLMDFSEVENRKPYNSGGRQIDGSFTLDGTTYLVELKFTKEQTGATSIDTFHKKVITKADNTMGVFISISGYSSVAKEEASGDKTPLLLLDFNHLYLVLGSMMNFGDVVRRVRRHASQTGEAYLGTQDFTG